MKRQSLLGLLLFVTVPIIYSLGGAVGHAEKSDNFAGLVEIGTGRKMYLKCTGEEDCKSFRSTHRAIFTAQSLFAMLLHRRGEATVP